MASKSYLSAFVILLFFARYPSVVSRQDDTWRDAICNSTPHPRECITYLPRNYSGDTRTAARFFVNKSLTISGDFLSLIDTYLLDGSLPGPTALALQDCRLLAELSLDSVARTHRSINVTDRLSSIEAEDLDTSLSAVLTNQDTCFESLREVTVAPSSQNLTRVLAAPITLGTKLYSISLALFKQGWVGNNVEDDDDDDLVRGVARQRKLLRTIADGGLLVSQRVVVDQNGTGNFTTIGEAVNAAPNNTAAGNNTYFVIHVLRGVYEEYVSIGRNKQNLMLIGDGIDQTVITGNRSVGDGWTTFNSATFAVIGQGFVGINITFRNTAGAVKRQAVAVRNGADLSAFQSCSFEGYQDTLYTHSLRQFYGECHVSGTVDFIFGNAAAVLQRCVIRPVVPLAGQFNVITAQGRSDPNQNTGTSLQGCVVRAAPATRTFLGRPWREFSRTVFMQTFMDASVDPAGWREWNGSFALATLYYAEFNNSGPGSNTTARVTWPGYRPAIPLAHALNFTVSNFIAGHAWLPATHAIPYTAGLLL